MRYAGEVNPLCGCFATFVPSPRPDWLGTHQDTMTDYSDVRAAILAGGSGSRLWPLSRQQTPKQFLKLHGSDTLFEATVRRLEPIITPERVLVVTGEDTARGEGFQVLEPFEKLLEPVGRNTAPAIGVAALHWILRGEDPVVVVLPADHLIEIGRAHV